jgi:predicted nucleic acid-binding protein
MLVDTSVWIDFFNGHASPEANRLVQALEEGGLITLPGLVLTEILLGFRSESEATRIHGLLNAFEYVKDPQGWITLRLQGFTGFAEAKAILSGQRSIVSLHNSVCATTCHC